MSLANIIEALNDRVLAREFRDHDQARLEYRLESNTCESFEEFGRILGDYFNHHYTRCNTHGGRFPRDQAISRAKEIIEQQYRRKHSSLIGAFRDAADGTNGGLRQILDILADSIKTEAIYAYTRDVFDRNVSPVRWEEKVGIMRQIMERFGSVLSPDLLADPPEKYAQNFEEIVQQIVGAIQSTASVFRRI